MSSQSERARGLILINGRAYPVNEVLEALERQAMTPLRSIGEELWVGNERIRPFSKTSPEQAMMLTCYGSLAYCCSLSRECGLRDEAIRLLGMSKEEYKMIQQECHQMFLRKYESRWPHDQVTASHSQAAHSSHLPFSGRSSQSEDEAHWRERVTASDNPRLRNFSQRHSETSPSVDLGSLFGTIEDQTQHTPAYSESQASGTRGTYERVSYSPDKWHPSHEFSTSSQSVAMETPRGFCIYCGQDLIGNSEFCSRCGRSQK
jgi:predicted metal-binding transcription factor (methanogenesis marker protein 9)